MKNEMREEKKGNLRQHQARRPCSDNAYLGAVSSSAGFTALGWAMATDFVIGVAVGVAVLSYTVYLIYDHGADRMPEGILIMRVLGSLFFLPEHNKIAKVAYFSVLG